jgi:PIN domain nuclease of toxin-antitoxin system
VILDSSAVLAFLQDEPGADIVALALPGAAISAVNQAEVVAKLRRLGETALVSLHLIDLAVLPFTAAETELAGELVWRHRGVVSLGDAACLATAKLRAVPVLTADRAWARLPSLGVEIRFLRP